MPKLALQQISSKFARSNAKKTLEKPILLKYVQPFLADKSFEELSAQCSDGVVYVWGSKLERAHQYDKTWPKDCLFLFRRGGTVFACAVFIHTAGSVGLAEKLWGFDQDEETWPLIYFFRKVWLLDLSAREINLLLNRSEDDHWQGLVVVDSPQVDAVLTLVRTKLGLHSNPPVVPRLTALRARSQAWHTASIIGQERGHEN